MRKVKKIGEKNGKDDVRVGDVPIGNSDNSERIADKAQDEMIKIK